jgi:hypothetical protein
MIASIVVLTSCHVDESVVRIDRPTAPEKLKLDFDVALPKTSRNMVLVSLASGLQNLEEFVRFEVDPGEREQAIQAIMNWDFGEKGGMSMYERKPLGPSAFPVPSASIGRVNWWNLGEIKHGFSYVRKVGTRALFVDEDRNIVYFYCYK